MARNPIGALLCLVLCIPFLAIGWADYEWALIAIAPKKWFGSTFIFKVGQ